MKRKANLSMNQISSSSNGEEFLIPCSRCTQQKMKKKTKKEAVSTLHICKEEMGIHLPVEIVMDILSRLPVRSLQRFKCVSQFWNALISDHCFIMKHLNRAKNDPLNSQKLLTSKRAFTKDQEVGFNSYSLSSSPVVQVIEDEQRLDDGPIEYVIRCCCDGLVLLTGVDRNNEVTSFLLWNPSTRESILLPSREYALSLWLYGLGYDTTSNDYKILAADVDADYSGDVSVQILPLKSGSWRKIGKYPTGMRTVRRYADCGMSSLPFIHGAFHWTSYKSPCYTIISFNISNEVYGEIPLLDWMYNYTCMFKQEHGVSVLRGMLCYYNTCNIDRRHFTFKLWTMKDYGVKESWIQWLAIPDIGVGSVIPHCVFADGNVDCYITSVDGLKWVAFKLMEIRPQISEDSYSQTQFAT